MDASMLSSNLLVVYAQQFTNKTFRFYTKHTTKKKTLMMFLFQLHQSLFFFT